VKILITRVLWLYVGFDTPSPALASDASVATNAQGYSTSGMGLKNKKPQSGKHLRWEYNKMVV
jgi:hypothetical protein